MPRQHSVKQGIVAQICSQCSDIFIQISKNSYSSLVINLKLNNKHTNNINLYFLSLCWKNKQCTESICKFVELFSDSSSSSSIFQPTPHPSSPCDLSLNVYMMLILTVPFIIHTSVYIKLH